jgi:hypothetical protein
MEIGSKSKDIKAEIEKIWNAMQAALAVKSKEQTNVVSIAR